MSATLASRLLKVEWMMTPGEPHNLHLSFAIAFLLG